VYATVLESAKGKYTFITNIGNFYQIIYKKNKKGVALSRLDHQPKKKIKLNSHRTEFHRPQVAQLTCGRCIHQTNYKAYRNPSSHVLALKIDTHLCLLTLNSLPQGVNFQINMSLHF